MQGTPGGPEGRFAPRCFPALLNAVSSPRGALTAVFGMGTGVTPPVGARTKRGQRDGQASCGKTAHSERGFHPRRALGALLYRARPPARLRAAGGGRRPGLTADQKRYAERLAALAHPPCQAGGLPAAFRALRPGRFISGGAWRLDAFSAYPFAAWLPGGAHGWTTGTPEAARPRSSRTRGRSRQPSSARGG